MTGGARQRQGAHESLLLEEKMPSNVARYERLFWASLLVWVLLLAIAIAGPGSHTILIATFVPTVGVMLLLIWLSARRRQNWARLSLLLLCLLGLPYTAMNLPEMSFMSASLNVLQALLQIGALILVFTGDAKAWFSRAL
jgi:hypothetical protein